MSPAQSQILIKEKPVPYHIAPQIKIQLENSKSKVVRGDLDRIFLIDGGEGGGKSTLALQLAYHIDPTLCLDDVIFNGVDLQKRIRYLAEQKIKHKAIIFDEAFNGLSSKAALSKMNRELVRLFMECRQLNLFIFIVLPSFFLLEKYVAIFRSHCLFHVYISKKDPKVRYYKVYNKKLKKFLYINGQKHLSYYKPRNKLSYRFFGKFPPTVDRDGYLDKKLKSFYDEDKKEVKHKWMVQRDFAIQKLYIHTKLTHKELGDMFESSPEPILRGMIGGICKNLRKTSIKTNNHQPN